MVGKTRRRLAVELITELDTTDRKLTALKKELTAPVTARGSTLLQLHGIGASSAARLPADVGDTHRFADRDRFAARTGTAPLDASSGNRRQTAGPGGQSGTTLQPGATDPTPDIGSSDKPHPGPANHEPRTSTPAAS